MTLVSATDERALVRHLLTDAGVAGADDFGRFVNDSRYFDDTGFDARSATTVLIEVLPTLTDAGVVETVALHLKNPAARPAAFEALLEAYLRWGTSDRGRVGWHLGEALVHSAPMTGLPAVLAIATDPRYGINRQQVILGLPRFRRSPATEETLRRLIHEPEVALQAMYALRRIIGPRQMVEVLEEVRREHPDTVLERQAKHEIRKIDRTIRRQNAV